MKRQIAVVTCAAACSMVTGTLLAFLHSEAPTKVSQRTLTFAERVAYQRAIEEVYWRHRIWPKENLNPKPSLDAVMSQAQLENKVADYLRESEELEDHWQKPITAEQLQAEMDRMARDTKQPEVLRELFAALGNDPFVVAECLARPALAGRFRTSWSAHDQRVHGELRQRGEATLMEAAAVNYSLPAISYGVGGCTDDTWTPTTVTNAPAGRFDHTAVWTGTEMIVWGGFTTLNTGGRYNPSTDSWTATSTINAPDGRYFHTAVWTGSEMIVWGGVSAGVTNTGGRYNPSTDSWTATSTTGAPAARQNHTAVWTGTQMIVWGGLSGFNFFNTGGRYDPKADSWTATDTTTAPDGRINHTAVWSGTQMIVWGGNNPFIPPGFFNTGGRYDPSTDSWTTTSITGAPDARESHTAVWSGTQMIVWGG